MIYRILGLLSLLALCGFVPTQYGQETMSDRRGIMLLNGTGDDSASQANGGDPTITFSPAPSIGDFVLVCGGFGDTADGAEILTAGYSANDIVDGDLTTSVALVCSYKFLTTNETTVQGEGGAGAADSANYGSYIFRGVDQTTPMDTTATTSFSASGVPTCATITPVTYGAVLVCACIGLITDVTGVTAPSGYTNLINVTVNDTDDTSTAFSISSPNNASPTASGTKAYGGFSAAAYVCAHIALRPAN